MTHNIINNEQNQYSHSLIVGLMDKRVAAMKKGVGEYTDLMRPTALN